MILTVPSGLQLRPNADDLDFSDLVPGITRSGPASWEADETLSIPFDPEPTTAQQQLIRRRLLTRDEREERIVTNLVALYAKLDPAKALEQTGRLLIEDRVARIEGW